MKHKRKAKTLKVRPDTQKRHYAKWTDKEITMLYKLSAEGMTSSQIAKVITTHSEKSIATKRTDLCLATTGRKWEPGEDDKLRFMWKNRVHTRDIAEALNRTETAVKCRAKLIGLKKRILFDASAIAFLKNNYHRMRTHFIASELNMTEQQIKAKAHELGLKSRP